MNWARHSPPDTGGVDATSRRSREASFNGADRVVQNGTTSQECILKHSINPNHPVCAAAVASLLFLDGAATPPVSGGELPASHSFTASKTNKYASLDFAFRYLHEYILETRSPRAEFEQWKAGIDETRDQQHLSVIIAIEFEVQASIRFEDF